MSDRRPLAAPAHSGIDPAEARRLVYRFVRALCCRLTKGGNSDADQRACFRLARRLVAQDGTLTDRFRYTLGLDRVVDPDESNEYVVANGLAVLTLDVYLQLRKLNDTGDVEAARREIEKVVKNWSDLIAGIPGAIRRPPGP